MKRLIHLFFYSAGTLLLTIYAPLTAMKRKAIPKATIIVVNGKWPDSAQFTAKGAFYKQLVAEVALHNASNPKATINLLQHTCPKQFADDDIFDIEKVIQAQVLAKKVLRLKTSGVKQIHIFAHGPGIDVTAITTQILNRDRERIGITKVASTRASSAESLEFQAAITRAREALYEREHIAAVTRSLATFSLDEASKNSITVHIVGELPGSRYAATINFTQDLGICSFVHHLEIGNPEDSAESGRVQIHYVDGSGCCCKPCCFKCLSCCKSCITDPAVQAIAKTGFEIVVTALLTAL